MPFNICADSVEHFDKMRFAVVEFPASHDERDWHQAYAVALHDEGSNQYKKTSLMQLQTNAKRFYDRTGKNSWEETHKELMQFYGSGKKMFVYRSIIVAQTMQLEWLQLLEKVDLPPSWFHENQYRPFCVPFPTHPIALASRRKYSRTASRRGCFQRLRAAAHHSLPRHDHSVFLWTR